MKTLGTVAYYGPWPFQCGIVDRGYKCLCHLPWLFSHDRRTVVVRISGVGEQRRTYSKLAKCKRHLALVTANFDKNSAILGKGAGDFILEGLVIIQLRKTVLSVRADA